MYLLRLLPLAALLAAGAAMAQTAGDCPALPGDSGLRWDKMSAPDLVFCKAIRDSDGAEMFAVTIAAESPFRPRRADREEKATIDGHEVWWYRGEIASAPDAQVRETLIELPDGRVAHISLRADSRDALNTVLRQAGGIRFEAPQLTSN